MQISKIKRKKINGLNYWAWPIKTAEMDRADSILRPFHLVVILPRQLATVDLTWCGRIASDQNSWSLNLRPFFVINVCDHSRRKVAIVSLRRPAFDLMFLVTKRS